MLGASNSTIHEAIGVALASGNMQGKNLDVVIALGAVSIAHPLADAVYRLKYANDAKSYGDALAAARNLAISLNVIGNWRLRRGRIAAMAKEVLDYWVSDACPVCEGRGWEKAQGAPHLTDRRCQACSGRHGERPGKRPFPWLVNRRKVKFRDRDTKDRRRSLRGRRDQLDRLAERKRHLLCAIEDVERRIGEKVIAKLAREVRQAGL